MLCVQDHLDPFWWSQHPLGGCEDGATAPNMSASAWHFAGRQIGNSHSVAGTLASFLQRQVVLAGELGLEMQLIVKWINGADNVYTPEFAFDQNQVLPPTASAQKLPTPSLLWLLRVLFSRQVVGKDSLRFYRKLFSYHYNVSNLVSGLIHWGVFVFVYPPFSDSGFVDYLVFLGFHLKA